MAAAVFLQILLAALLASPQQASGEACPCTWSATDAALSCRDLGLQSVPRDCFLDHPEAVLLDLSGNSIESLGEDDFSGLDAVEALWLSRNKISSLHSRTFRNLCALAELHLDQNALEVLPEGMLAYQPSIREFSVDNNNLIKLPLSLFADGLQAPVTLNLTSNYLRAVPCSAVSSLPVNSTVSADYVQIWAQHEEEMASCSLLNLPELVSLCMPVDTRSNSIDCTALREPFSPLKASLAESESHRFFDGWTEHIVFSADVDDLMGEPPSQVSCLPDDLDVAGSFLVFHRYNPDLQLEGLFFDMADLPSHTSELTNSVTIKADTVVLTRPIPPLRYRLTVSARNVVLAHPLLMEAPTTLYPPTTTETFYQLQVSAGRVNGVTVIQYEHGLLTVRLLDGADVVAKHSCQPLPVYSEDEVREWVSARQLWLTVYCSSTLRESDERETLLYARDLASFVTRLTTNWTKVDMVGTSQRATNLLYDINAALSNSLLPRNVPYLSVSVYAEMVPYLADTIAVYKEAYDDLRRKLMVNAERLFDMNIHFEERKADLEFMQSNAQRAVEMAEEVHSVHSAQLQNHVSWAISSWKAIMDIYENVLASRPQVNDALDRAEEGLKAYKRQQRFVSFLNVGTTFARCIMGFPGGTIGVIRNVGEIVSNAFEFKSSGETMEEITEKIEAVNVMMVKTESFMSAVPPLPPADGDQLAWLMTFNDSETLYAIARQAGVTADQWESAGVYSIKCLADEDFSDKVDGVKNLKMKLNELRVWSQALAEQVQAFCEYVASILEEVTNLAEDAEAVEEGSAALDSVNGMLVDQAVTEENYKEHIVEQNLAVLDVMMKLFLKSRSDILAINVILHEYCSAYFYAFFKDCDPTNSPSLWDNYDTVLYKLNKIQFESLNSIASLSPPPQPFQKTIRVLDSASGCEGGAATSEGAACPVSALAFSGSSSFNLAEHWGAGLSFGARIRMDRLRIYLEGLHEHTVTIDVKRPAIFNDTYKGQEFTFRGHLEECRVEYEETALLTANPSHGDEKAVSYVTDCSTHQQYQLYYYRTSPDGMYTFTWREFQLGVDYSNLTALELYLEGSWIPNF